MQNLCIAFTDVNKAEIIDVGIKEPAADEVLVKLAVSTISSGTERANLMGSGTTNWREAEQKKPVYPRFGGYSSAGVVEKVGANVTKVKPGDRVSVCWSQHSQYTTVTERNVTKIDDVSFENGAFYNIASFPLAAIRKCRLEIGESAIIMGMGILGMVAVKLLKIGGAVPIIAVDPDAAKREKALELGADYALDPYDPDFAKTAKELTNGGANVGIEVTGIGAGLDGILDCMACFGRVALLGCTRNSDFTIDYYRKVHGPGITLVGAHTAARPKDDSRPGFWTQPDDNIALKILTESGRINLAEMVEETHSPLEGPEIYQRLCNDKTFPVVQFDWRKL